MKKTDFETLYAYLEQGGTFKELAEVNEGDLNVVYRYALQLMTAEDFEGAKRILYFLTKVDQWGFDYFFNLGICFHELKQHEEAIFCFSRSAVIKMQDPRSSFYAGHNYLALGKPDFATKAYKASLLVCECHPQGVWDEFARGVQASLDKVNV